MNSQEKTPENKAEENALLEKGETPATPPSPVGATPSETVEGVAAKTEKGEADGVVEEADGFDELLKKLNESQARAKEIEDRFLRAVADLENFRKRTLRDKEELRKYGIAGLMEDLLPVLDHLDIGLQSARQHPEAKGVTEGFSMVANQLEGILKEHGIREIDPRGAAFDPNFHDCVSHQPSASIAEGMVMAVTRKGYKLHDRLLRPASVVVSSGPQTEEGD